MANYHPYFQKLKDYNSNFDLNRKTQTAYNYQNAQNNCNYFQKCLQTISRRVAENKNYSRNYQPEVMQYRQEVSQNQNYDTNFQQDYRIQEYKEYFRQEYQMRNYEKYSRQDYQNQDYEKYSRQDYEIENYERRLRQYYQSQDHAQYSRAETYSRYDYSQNIRSYENVQYKTHPNVNDIQSHPYYSRYHHYYNQKSPYLSNDSDNISKIRNIASNSKTNLTSKSSLPKNNKVPKNNTKSIKNNNKSNKNTKVKTSVDKNAKNHIYKESAKKDDLRTSETIKRNKNLRLKKSIKSISQTETDSVLQCSNNDNNLIPNDPSSSITSLNWEVLSVQPSKRVLEENKNLDLPSEYGDYRDETQSSVSISTTTTETEEEKDIIEHDFLFCEEKNISIDYSDMDNDVPIYESTVIEDEDIGKSFTISNDDIMDLCIEDVIIDIPDFVV